MQPHTALRHLALKITQNFWFVPIVLTVLGGVGGLAAIAFDETAYARELVGSKIILAITVDGGRSVVSTVAGGIVTMASLVFSLTFIALTLMSQQLGPRLIPIFVRDRFAKFTFGLFTGAFLFSLVVLVVTGTGQKGNFVPVFSLLAVIALAVVSFCLMIVYINHIATAIQADTLIVRLGTDMKRALEKSSADLTTHTTQRASDFELDWVEDEHEGVEIRSSETGYIAAIDTSQMVKTLEKHDLCGVLLCRPGHFCAKDMPIMRIAPRSFSVDREIASKLLEAIVIEPTRAVSETGEFELNALVEVALRALSPGMNDTYTALACIDQITAAFIDILKGGPRTRSMKDSAGKTRLLLYDQGFNHFLNTAFHPIRHAARDNPLALGRLANAYLLLNSAGANRPEVRRNIAKHLKAMKETIKNNVSTADDREHLLQHLVNRSLQK